MSTEGFKFFPQDCPPDKLAEYQKTWERVKTANWTGGHTFKVLARRKPNVVDFSAEISPARPEVPVHEYRLERVTEHFAGVEPHAYRARKGVAIVCDGMIFDIQWD